MDERDLRDRVQDDPEAVVEAEAVEVETVEPVGEQIVEEEEGMGEDEDIPPFLERGAAAGDELEAGEVEPEAGARADHAEEGYISLFDNSAAPEYRKRWMGIQAHFVDDPQASVREADELVDQVIKHISDTFARQRSELESHWKAEDDTESSTEDLRLAVKRYHTFFDQLLNLKA